MRTHIICAVASDDQAAPNATTARAGTPVIEESPRWTCGYLMSTRTLKGRARDASAAEHPVGACRRQSIHRGMSYALRPVGHRVCHVARAIETRACPRQGVASRTILSSSPLAEARMSMKRNGFEGSSPPVPGGTAQAPVLLGNGSDEDRMHKLQEGCSAQQGRACIGVCYGFQKRDRALRGKG